MTSAPAAFGEIPAAQRKLAHGFNDWFGIVAAGDTAVPNPRYEAWILQESGAHLAPENLAIAASRLDSVLVGYDSATGTGNEKRLPSLEAA